jgi:hypothetical protein
MVVNQKLNVEQMQWLSEQQEFLELLHALEDSPEFQSLFGDMSLGEAIERFEATLEEDDAVLRERYQRIQSELADDNQTDMLKKLRDSADAWDKELGE